MRKRICDYIKEARINANYSQNKLAKKTGIPQSIISLYESGSSYPGTLNLILLADALNITIDELVGRKTDKKNISSKKLISKL